MAECRIARNAPRSIPPAAAFLPLLGSPVVHPCGEQAAGDGGTHRENDLARHRLPVQLELLDDEVRPEVFAGFGLSTTAVTRKLPIGSGMIPPGYQSGRLDTNGPRSKPSRASMSL